MRKSIIILGFIIVSISLSVVLKVSLAFGFLPPIVLVLTISPQRRKSAFIALDHVVKCKSVFAIILLLGANIAMWMASGILPTIIYYGFNMVDRVNLLFMTFMGSALISTVMGTGLGTFSTIGIVFLGLAVPLGYPKAVVIGTIVSGAFISDKISPVAALSNLTLQMTQVTYKDYVRQALKTLLPTMFITGMAYYLLDFSFRGAMIDTLAKQNLILDHFNISLWLLILPLVMLIMSIRGIHTIVSMGTVFILGGLTSIFYQGTSIALVLEYVLWGHKMTTGTDFMDTIFKGGGMIPMVEVLIIVALAIFLTGLLMSNHLLTPLIDRLMVNTHRRSTLIFKTAIMSIFLTSLTCDQTVGITVPGELLQDHYKAKAMPNTLLARTISDTGTIIAPLEFWNVNALIITGLTGISALEYGPYAFLCYIAPLVTLVYAKLILDKNL